MGDSYVQSLFRVVNHLGMVTGYMLAVLVVGLVGLLIVLRYVIKRNTRPLEDLTKVAYKIARGDFSARLPRDTPDGSVRTLVDAFAHYAAVACRLCGESAPVDTRPGTRTERARHRPRDTEGDDAAHVSDFSRRRGHRCVCDAQSGEYNRRRFLRLHARRWKVLFLHRHCIVVCRHSFDLVAHDCCPFGVPLVDIGRAGA